MIVREQHPLQQGLRPCLDNVCATNTAYVREQHPLQQGLRRRSSSTRVYLPGVREQHPLQQGLRPLY